jgi:hypothetical protein
MFCRELYPIYCFVFYQHSQLYGPSLTHPMLAPMNAAELARRKPVWLALSEFYLDTELQPADFRRIRAIFDQSGYSAQEIRQIDYEEVGPVLYGNLLSMAGEWAGFDEAALLVAVGKRAAKSGKIRGRFPIRWLWQKGIDYVNGAYFRRVFAS